MAGGAEAVTHEVARRLVRQGDEVEWFSAAFPGAAAEEDLDGVRVRRQGRQWSVHWHAYRRYRGRLAGRFDVVVDQVNTIPFFAPLWADIPTVMFIHQLAREVWWYESAFPLNALGYAAEPQYLRSYRRTPVITVSESTRADLLALGFGGPITVVPEGLEVVPQVEPQAPAEPSFVHVGRLTPSKRADDIIRAFAQFATGEPQASLTLIGEGQPRYVMKLSRLAARLGVGDRVRFAGWVSNEDKFRLLATAHALLMASVREGWGLAVTEANALGVPAIAYRVPGLVDSVRDGESGLLVDPTPEAMARAMRRLWLDPDLRSRLSANAVHWSGSFSYDRTAAAFRSALEVAVAPEPSGAMHQ